MSEFIGTLNNTVSSIREAINIGHREFLDVLKLTQKDYLRIINGLDDYSIENIYELSEHFDLSLDNLVTGKVDYRALARQCNGDLKAMPEKYSDERLNFGRARTIIGVEKYISRVCGENVSKMIFRKLQVNRLSFDDPDERVNTHFMMDLFKECVDEGLDPIHLVEMGKASLSVNKNTIVGKTLSAARTPKELFEILHGTLLGAHYDNGFDYKIHELKNDSMVLHIERLKDAHEIMGVPTIGNRQLCLYKQGAYGSFICNLNIPYPTVVESQCVYLGHPKCVYHISWDHRTLVC